MSASSMLNINRHTILYICMIVVALASCRGGNNVSSVKEGGDTLQLKYATLLTIVDYDGYSVATIRNPWKPDKTLHKYVLIPKEEEREERREMEVESDATVIYTPIERAAVFTTVHCALLQDFGREGSIVGVADSKYIKIPYIHEQIKQGKIVDCGNGLNPVVEKIMDIKPAAILLSPFENSGGYGKVEDINIPIVECAEYMEKSPLARAEWMKFYGRLFGAQEQADSLFAIVDSSYHALKARAQQAGEGRSVLMDKMVGNVWYVPGGQSTIGQMLQDAGGRYPWATDDQSGSLSLAFETVLERGGECDVWLFRYSSDHPMTLRELAAEHRGYDQLQAFRSGEVYGCNVEQSLFYEETPFRPDILLAELLQILHPDITNLPPLRYYKKIGWE